MRYTAVVTGGSGGIGRACALRLARDGFQVIALYHTHPEPLEALQKTAREEGFQIDPAPCDVADPADTARCFAQIRRLYHHVDVLVCTAGVAHIGLLTDTDEGTWDRIINVNLTGTYRAVREVLPDMISRQSGSIITMSSMWGEVGASCEAAYSAAKAGIIGLTKALAKEVGPSGVRVNCVSPGLIDTAMNRSLGEDAMKALEEETPLGRRGTPEDVAHAVSFLAGERSSFITGQVIGVSGGFIV